MAKKNSNPTHSSTTRTVLIIVLVALVLGLVLVGAKIAMDKQQLATQSDGTIAGTKALTGYSEPATYETGKGWWQAVERRTDYRGSQGRHPGF